jgi:uncharacterized repeat protein (TIGR01451 family)
MIGQVVALSGTGVGIRVNGVAKAYVGQEIEYVITAQNLGDYWITNTTVTDIFPNGTSSSWKIPDLAPEGKSGSSFNVSNIFYTIQYKDVSFVRNVSCVIDNAEVMGYSVIQGLKALALAKTEYYTFIQAVVPVGGYSVGIKTEAASLPTPTYTVLLFIITATFTMSSKIRRGPYHKRRVLLRRN